MGDERKENKLKPLSAYYSLENWLYNQPAKDIKTKSAMLWGGL